MLKENIMNGKLPDDDSAPFIGTGYPFGRIKKNFEATLTDLSISVKSQAENCVILWDRCDNADCYRVDIYRIEDRGPDMGCLNYIAVETKEVTDNKFTTSRLEAMNSYRAVVFALNNGKVIGRYSPIYCIVTPEVFGNMQEDYEEIGSDIPVADNNSTVEFKSLPAEKSVLLCDNPDRGFRSEEDYFIPEPEKLKEWTPEKVFEDVKNRIERNTNSEKVKVSRIHFVLDKYMKTDILPQVLLDYLQSVYDAYRKLGIKMYLCHYYQHGIMGTENVSQEIVLSHLKQLKPLFCKNEDLLFAMNFSFIGSYGEWTGIRNNIDRQVIVNAFMDAAPEKIRLIIRQPLFKATFINKDYWRYNRIGFADDACHGLMFAHVDLGQSYWQPGTEWWEKGIKESVYTINDTELFTTRWILLSGSWTSGYSCMKSLSQKHTSTLSIQHAFGDASMYGVENGQTLIYGWKSQKVTPEILNEFGLACSEGWFTDKNGNKTERNVFEYLRDYLGYRISLKSAHLKINKEINIDLKLENYGYTAAFNLLSNVELIDGDGNVVSSCVAGNPDEWYGTNPEDYSDREILEHNISVRLALPQKSGEYMVAFVLKNAMNQYARLDNDVNYENGKNILFKIDI